ncbi:unnamed protein product [Dicrocoelium dendriticum]|nr:unnamed protein product [Dicrocoelium dendriticum]
MLSAIRPLSGVTLLFASSVRNERNNDRVLELVKWRLLRRGHDVRIVDPKELGFPLLGSSWSNYTNPWLEAPEELIDLVQLVTSAERFIFTACEYNRCISPALSNILNYLPTSAVAYKTAGIISYSIGPVGGQMTASQLRLVLLSLGFLVVPHSMVLYSVEGRISQDGQPIGSHEQSIALVKEIDMLLGQVEYVSSAMHEYGANHSSYLPHVHP